MANDVEAMGEGARAVSTAESTRLRAFVAHVARQGMLDLVPGWRAGEEWSVKPETSTR